MTLAREFETLFFIIIASILGLLAVFYFRSPKNFQQMHISAPLPSFVTAQLTPIPSPTPVPVIKTTTSSWTASDGLEKITMKTITTPSLTSTYAFTVTNTTTNTDTSLFVQTIPGISSMSIPFNVFSSDDSYLYLKETIGAQNHYLVFMMSGQAFQDGKSYFDVSPIFSTYTSSYTLSDVIGWASPTLLILTTKKSDGSIGPSYWLDVTTRGIIPLSTVFE